MIFWDNQKVINIAYVIGRNNLWLIFYSPHVVIGTKRVALVDSSRDKWQKSNRCRKQRHKVIPSGAYRNGHLREWITYSDVCEKPPIDNSTLLCRKSDFIQLRYLSLLERYLLIMLSESPVQKINHQAIRLWWDFHKDIGTSGTQYLKISMLSLSVWREYAYRGSSMFTSTARTNQQVLCSFLDPSSFYLFHLDLHTIHTMTLQY